MSIPAFFAPRIARYQRFHAHPGPALLGVMHLPHDPAIPLPFRELTAFDWRAPADWERWALLRVAYHQQARLMPKQQIDDDDMHTIQVLIGTGTVAASYGDLDPHFEVGTSYLPQLITDYDRDLPRLRVDPANPWLRAQLGLAQALAQRWDGCYTILPFTHFDAFDLANQFRGDDIMLDFHDRPDAVRRLLDRCADLLIEVERLARAALTGYDLPGVAMTGWMPGGTYLSCDLADLVSPEIFQQFNAPVLQRTVTALGPGGYLHHHELGYHQMDNFAAISGLSFQLFNRDPNTRHLAEVLDDRMIASSHRLAIHALCTYDELRRTLDRFRQGRFLLSVLCDSQDEAQRALELVRRYSP